MPASRYARVIEGRGTSKTAFRMGAVPSDSRFRKRLEDVAKAVTAANDLTDRQKVSLARKKRLNGALSLAGGAAGVTGLGLMAAKKPKAALWASTTGGGIGGINALINTPIQRAEAKAIDPRKIKKSARFNQVVVPPTKGKLIRSDDPRMKKRLNGKQGWRQEPRDVYGSRVVKSAMMPTGLSVPRGLVKTKAYTDSHLRKTTRGQLVRVKAGVR